MNPTCPIPLSDYPHILMAHGSGGLIMQRLIDEVFFKIFGTKDIKNVHDSAILQNPGKKIAMTTDSFVIQPLEFPGGDIGSLSVHGTVNDLAVSGAKPLYLSASFILEEGLPVQTLVRIVHSMKTAADEAGVTIVTGDTKVVEKGKGDGIYINTTGIGVVNENINIGTKYVRPGDAVLVNGDPGRHGMAIMAVRENLSFETGLKSDSACLAHPILEMLEKGLDITCMRDATRGGLAAVLNEIAAGANLGIEIDEPAIPVNESVRNACEILGFDPLQVANEGRFITFCSQSDATRALEILKKHSPKDVHPAIIGAVTEEHKGTVTIKTAIGTERIMDMPNGELLPRIC